MPRPHRTPAAPARLALLAALAGTAGLAACGDSSGPGASIDVALELESKRGPYIGPDETGATRVSCEVVLRATATGGGRATWTSGTWYWYAGPDRSEPIDSSRVASATISQSWGQGSIAASDTLRSGWTFWAGIPFGLEIEYRYRPDGGSGTKSTRVAFDCGPTVPPDAPPPEIVSLEVTPSSGEVEAGGSVTVTYTAHSDLGIWRTDVDLVGPCDLHREFTAENLRKTITRSVTLDFPAECRLGERMDVGVSVVDAAMVEAHRVVATQVVLVDHTPPSLLPLFFSPQGGSAQIELAGDFFVGDSIQMISNAGDNYELATLYWEVLPFGDVDSLVVNAPGAPWYTFIRLRPEWTGEITLRLWARDHQGLESERVSPPGSATVRPTIERPTRSATVQGDIQDFVIDERRGVIHLLQWNWRRLTTLSAQTLAVLSSVEIPSASGIDLVPGGDSIVLAMRPANAVGVLDLTTPGAAVSVIPLEGIDASLAQYVWDVRVASNRRAFVGTHGNAIDAAELYEVDLTTGAQRVRDDLAHDAWTSVRSLDHTTLVALGQTARRYDPATGTFGPPGPEERYGELSLDATGNRMAYGLDVYDGSLRFLRRVESLFGGGVPISALGADGEHLYQVHWRLGIVRSRTSDGALLDRTPNAAGIQPTAMRVSPDGSFLVTIESYAGATSKVSVIDLR